MLLVMCNSFCLQNLFSKIDGGLIGPAIDKLSLDFSYHFERFIPSSSVS